MDGLGGCGEARWSGDMTLEEANGSGCVARGTVVTCVTCWPISGPIVMGLGH